MAATMSNSNMELWHRVQETDMSYTKPVSIGHKHTSINTNYMIMRATEQWGPMGKGWGCDVLSQGIESMGPIYRQVPKFDEHGKPAGTEQVHICDAKIHTLHMRLWYLADGERCEVNQFGHTKTVFETKDGIMTDGDYAKKSWSDAMKKCLSLLGFSADIYLGMFEDHEYAQEANIKAQQKKEERKLDREQMSKTEAAQKRQELGDWLQRIKEQYPTLKSERALNLLHKQNLAHAETHCPRVGVDLNKMLASLNEAYFNQLDVIKEPQDTVCTACGNSGLQHIHRPCAECGGKVKPAE